MGVEIVVDQKRPVAAIVDARGTARLVTWPVVEVGLVEPLATLVPGPDGAWVHYPPSTVSLMDDSHDDVLAARDSPAVQVRPDGSISVVRLADRRAIGATTGTHGARRNANSRSTRATGAARCPRSGRNHRYSPW